MKHVAGFGYALLFADGEEDAPALDKSDLLMRVIVRWRNDEGREAQAADH